MKNKKNGLKSQSSEIADRQSAAKEQFEKIKSRIASCNGIIDQGKNEIIDLLNQKGSVKGELQRYDMVLEQINIRTAKLNQRKLRRKSEEADLEAVIEKYRRNLKDLETQAAQLKEREQDSIRLRHTQHQKKEAALKELELTMTGFHKVQSRLETLRNIAERYDGYGNSIRRIMECRQKEPGIHGVVADLIKTDKKYETAIETALGGSIQNIVTEDEGTAKRMVQYLKENKYGRATFLPLTSVRQRSMNRNERALSYEGVIGMANTLVKTDPAYEGIMAYLLGRVIVADHIDHAVALAREFNYSLHIVTLEGEHLSPGGSISGGAFRNSSNLLGRKREIDELKSQLEDLTGRRESLQHQIQTIQADQELLRKEEESYKTKIQEAYLEQNAAKMNLDRVLEQKYEGEKAAAALAAETAELNQQKAKASEDKNQAEQKLEALAQKEAAIQKAAADAQESLEQLTQEEQQAAQTLSQIQLEEANFTQQTGFIQENLKRIDAELAKLDEELLQLESGAKQADEDVVFKEQEIEKLKKRAEEAGNKGSLLEQTLAQRQQLKEETAARQKHSFQKREELSGHTNRLDKEIFRLNSQKEKLEDAKESQTNYMWTEYELTPHNAMELRDEQFQDPVKTKQLIVQTKDEIRKLGDVNVNAIEEYKEVSERYGFLKTQHDDLVQAEQTLLQLIDELDTGMRRQFAEKFADIQREFDKAFKQLFGGGKGTLELVEEEDILECGIRIIAHPPGKKLQNMMQLSGGEKSLTAIALLFAIQNLKPSPFCLLDEIEAALDDSNVDRFAKYLHKLTQNTQFIVITHRRGTMAAADRLYGITMQEKGVSALVSVSLVERELK